MNKMEHKQQQQSRRNKKSIEIGELAQRYRQKAGVRVQDIVINTGYSSSLIYAFENGKSTNYIILFDCYFAVMPEPHKTRLFNSILATLNKE